MANVGSGATGKTLIGAGNGASPTFATIGTNSGLTQHGVVIAEGNGAFVATSPGTTGQILTSNGSGSDPSFQTPGTIQTISGDSGSISGLNVTLFANNATLNSGSSVKFVNSGTISTLNVTDSNSNTMIGTNSGTSGMSGTQNTSLGRFSCNTITSGGQNTSVGYGALSSLGSGTKNVGIGWQALASAASGQSNIALGYNAGGSYTTSDSNNITIGSLGITGESNAVRLGIIGSHTTCYIAGIAGVSTSNTTIVTQNSVNAQLGVVSTVSVANGGTGASTLTGVLTGNGTSAVTASAVTQHGVLVGGASNAVASTAVGSTGQVLQANTSADPTYSTATYPSVATTTGTILRANGTNWVATTATYPTTTTINQILYSSSASVIAGLATANNGVLITSAGGVPSLLAAGTTGQVLTATTGSPATWASPAASSITITGDSGSITGGSLTVYANNAGNICGASIKFVNSSTTSTLNVTDGLSNVFLGSGAGTTTVSGANNSGQGRLVLASVAAGDSNCGLGSTCLTNVTSGSRNVAMGVVSLQNLVSGNNNTAVGYASGQNCTTNDSNNIYLSNAGTAGDNAKIAIGTNGTHTTCFIQGISGVTVTGTAVLCSTAGQLGTVVSSARYKENIQPIGEEVSILHLEPKSFNYKKDKTTKYGLIAEEVDAKFPYLCFYNDKQEPESVMYHELSILLLHEIQKLNKRIQYLESKVA